jgi:hypothetical protein
MHKKLGKIWIAFIIFAATQSSFSADMNVQLTSSDGSTKFSVQNAAALDVATVDSLGNATFTKVTQTGTGGSFIVNQNALQAGATFYISSGTATSFNTTTLKFADGTTQATAGTLNGVTAGYGMTGGGASGNVTVNLIPNATAYIQNTASLQTGATFYVSSGTATNFNTSTLKFADGTTQTTAGTLNGVTAGLGLSGGGISGNPTLSLASNSTNYIQNSSTLQSGTTFFVTSGTVNAFNIGASGTIAGKYRIGAIQGLTSNNFLFQFSSATVNGSQAITFANAGLKAYVTTPSVLVSPVYTLASSTLLTCYANNITATGMTIQCVTSTPGALGSISQDSTNREVDYLLMGVAP